MQISAKADFFRSHLENCQLCPRMCGVNRLRGELGFCMAGNKLKIASYCLHFGEEPPISGNRGSGTIFFAHCNMRCVYCQNFPISHMGHGNHVEPAGLASMMLELQTAGAHNINLVTPTHFLPRIVEGLLEARADGLTLPVVYNSSGFERPETVRMLSGLVQVYLVDMRYSTEKSARRYSKAPDYPRYNRLAVREMLSQVSSPPTVG
jgi:putative pyruvate formate lyase activating enzyme